MSTQPTTKRIRIANPPLDANNRTSLTADVVIGATTLNVISTTGKQFLTTGGYDYYLLIEGYEKEKGEFVLVDASDAGTDDNSFTVSATKYSHESSDPVIYSPYNQIRIYGSLTLAGAKVLIDTVDIDPTEQYTDFIFDDSTYSFFFTAYYNATLDVKSAYSDEIVASSFGQNSVKKIIESAVRKAMTNIDENPDSKLNWDTAIDIVNDGLNEIILRKKKWSFLHKVDSTTYHTVANQVYLEKPADLAILEHLIIDNNTLDWWSRKKYDEYTKSGSTASTGQPAYYTTKNNQFYFYPTPTVAYDVILEYYKYPTEITDLTDEVDKPFVSILMYYCAANFCWIRGNDKRGDKMYTLFQKTLEQQVEEYSGPDQLGDAESIELTNNVSQDEEYQLLI
jgi:hypothetical protein